ncbi:helix-turn-helix domain-containing protein [Amycolatopsis sp. cmx-11-51]|uniref:helix-turn-helix domain-containing protein n=1 Tax=Amycolatopsis sp. cmx-11-51 TaxID=2785797 RepID=UPI0039E24ECF
MSVQAVRWAAEQQAGAPMPKLVLYALAEHANRDGYATTSLGTLARETEASRRTVMRGLDALVERRLIARTRRQRGTGADTSSEYRLMIHTPGTRDSVTPPTGGHTDSPGGQNGTPPESGRHPGNVGQTPHVGVTATPQGEPELQNRTTELSHHARPRTRGTATPAELSATASRPDAYRLVTSWHDQTGAAYRPAMIRALAKQADGILRDGGALVPLRAALDEWDRRPDARPGLLPHLYDDAVKATRRAERPTTRSPAPRSVRGEKVRGWLALAAESAPADAEPVELLVADGVQS